MSSERTSAWTKAKSEKTLESLRKDYPRYTDNELYAIWCHNHGLIPLDASDKLDLDSWRIHAAHDGQHVFEDGFKVSRATYGRAMRARKGTPKARRKVRPKSQDNATPPLLNGSAPISARALQIAKNYDRAAAVLDQALARREECIRLVASLRDVDPCIAFDLASRSPAARELLEQAKVLAAEGQYEETE